VINTDTDDSVNYDPDKQMIFNGIDDIELVEINVIGLMC